MFKFKRTAALFFMLLMCFTFFGCGRENKSAASFLMKVKSADLVSSEKEDKNIFCDKEILKEKKRVSGTDMAALYFNEKNSSVSVYDSGSSTTWRSLPSEYRGVKTGVICIKALLNGNEYVLNSQGHGTATYEIKDKSVAVAYTMRAEDEKGNEFGFTVPVEFTDVDGTLTVQINCDKIEKDKGSKNAVLKSISLLPYFGAFYEGEKGDFILLPDGSGATVDVSSAGKKAKKYSVKIYGADVALNEKEKAFATVPAFGIKKGDGAIAATVDEGEAVCTVKAETASKSKGFNTVYPEFEITPAMKNDDGSYYVSEVSYKGKIKVSYRFLSKDSADYIGMAGACRELFIRNAVLSESNITEGSEYPFNLSFIGMSHTADGEGKVKQEVLCSFSEAHDVLQNLNAKDINSINLKYKGIYTGGTLQQNISDAKVLSALGSKAEFKGLTAYALSNSVDIYPEINLFTAYEKKGFRNYSLGLDGESNVINKEGYGFEFAGVGVIEENTKKVLSDVREGDFEGLCLCDAGYLLYSDFSSEDTALRSDIRQKLHSQANSASSAGRLMVEKGNLYAVKYASVITELPSSAFYADGKKVESVPFVQAILHGIADYSHSPLNLEKDSTDAFLKSVEYGAVPSYEWYCADKGGEKKPDKYYFMNSLSEAQNFYSRMKKAFSEIRTERITDHREVKKNVFLTQYGSGSQVYVNYNDKPVTVSGVNVDAKSFIKVN